MSVAARVISMDEHRKPGPQLEDGYIRIANELFDAVLRFRFTLRQQKVLLGILRKTYGYGKKEDDLSASQIGAIVCMPRPHVAATLVELERLRVITRTRGRYGMLTAINKRHQEWIDPDDTLKKPTTKGKAASAAADKRWHYVYRLTRLQTGEFYIGVRSCDCLPAQDRYMGSGCWPASVKRHEVIKTVLQVFESRSEAEEAEKNFIRAEAMNPQAMNRVRYESGEGEASTSHVRCTDSVRTPVQNSDFDSTDYVQVDSTEYVHTKDNLPKDNQKTTSTVHVQPTGRTRKRPTANDRFDRFWSAYPNPKSKAAALKAFAKIDPDEDLLRAMIERVELMKRTDDWLKDAGRYIPMGASWLNGRGWEDGAPITTYTADELQVIEAYNLETDGTDWPEALTEPYSRERAGIVRAFMVFSKGGAKGATAYFRYVADNVPTADTTGFDWLMRRETYLKIREGVHRSRGGA